MVSKGLSLTSLNSNISTIIAIGCAVVVYAFVVLFTRGIYRDDVYMMPKGEKIAGFMDKFNLLDK